MKKLLLSLILMSSGLALAQDAKTQEDNNQALITALNQGTYADVEKIVKSGKVDKKGITEALYWASGMPDDAKIHDEAKLLIKSGADINVIPDTMGYTPLIYATIFGNKDMVKLLILNGADTGIKQYGKTSALDFATNALEAAKEKNNAYVGLWTELVKILKTWEAPSLEYNVQKESINKEFETYKKQVRAEAQKHMIPNIADITIGYSEPETAFEYFVYTRYSNMADRLEQLKPAAKTSTQTSSEPSSSSSSAK